MKAAITISDPDVAADNRDRAPLADVPARQRRPDSQQRAADRNGGTGAAAPGETLDGVCADIADQRQRILAGQLTRKMSSGQAIELAGSVRACTRPSVVGVDVLDGRPGTDLAAALTRSRREEQRFGRRADQ